MKSAPRLNVRGKISVGDAIETQSGIGIVMSVERVKLSRYGRKSDRYNVSDGDYKWVVDRRNVKSICMHEAAKVLNGPITPAVAREAVERVSQL